MLPSLQNVARMLEMENDTSTGNDKPVMACPKLPRTPGGYESTMLHRIVAHDVTPVSEDCKFR